MNASQPPAAADPARPAFIPPLAWRILAAQQNAPVLFPAAAARPATLLWVWLLPQALLLFLNWQAWDLASGEMSAVQRTTALTIFGLECALLLCGLAAFVVTLFRGRVSRLTGGLLLLGASVYLAAVIIDASGAIPASVQEWMLPPTQWIYNQFAIVGLGALYGAFRLLCPDREHAIFVSVMATLAALAAPFAMLALFISAAASGAIFGAKMEWLKYLAVPVFLCGTFLSTGALLRICISLYAAARRKSPAVLVVVTAFIALALPLAGLLTNNSIAFPADFQAPLIYALAVLNGIVLCLPNFSNPLAHRTVWLAQCLLFPFTTYFFAVFLPLLPLMPIGAMFFGLGLLICVPSALFLLHGCRILDGLRAENRDGRRWLPPVLAAGAIAIGPVLLTTQILRDRASLHQALDHIAYPNYAQPAFTGDRAALRTALLNLRNFKEGRYLPLYSEFYNWLAFDNLLLPDKKLAETWTAFFGEPMPAANAGALRTPFFGMGRSPSASEILNGPPAGERPPATATTASLRTIVTPAPGEVRATAFLTVANATATPAEYRALIHVPPGVFVTGMRLTIGADSVPAKLFEERSALWVYNRITEVRPVPRDPAILRYIAPGLAELRVYPVESMSARHVEIEFVYPDNLAPVLTVDGRRLDLPPAQKTTALRSGDAVWIPHTALAGIPPLRRTAQPHLIIDASKNSQLQDPKKLTLAIQHALAAFPGARTARVSFANFETREFENGAPIPVEKLRALAPAALIEAAGRFEGGFLEAPAIKTALSRARAYPPETIIAEYPAVIVLRGGAAPLDLGRKDLPQFASLVPDAPFWRSLDSGAATPVTHALDPDAAQSGQIADVFVLQTGDRREAIAAGQPALLFGLQGDQALTIYDPTTKTFVPLSAPVTSGAAISAAVEPWALAKRRTFQPSAAGEDSLARLIASARQASVLVPSTAYMVVENSAQWKMLERTEKKALKSHEALTLAETSSTPEPGVVALILVAGLLLLARRTLPRLMSPREPCQVTDRSSRSPYQSR